MARDKLIEYDQTAANNTVIGDVNTSETMLPSEVNDAFRELGDEGQYPIYDLDSYTYYDEFGREIVEFVATVTSYYP